MKQNQLEYNYIMKKKNNARHRQYCKELSLKGAYDRKIAREEKYGTNDKMIITGQKDRLACNPPQIIEENKEKKSYLYGYFERGSRVLAGEFAKGKYSKEEQRKFGRIDLINGVKEKHLIELNNYPDYIKGRIYQMGRNIYDYIILNDLEIESYISLISTVCPKVSDPEFIKGYYDEETLRKKYKKQRKIK